MSDASRRVQAAATDARSNDDRVVSDEIAMAIWDNDMLVSPLDQETLDERASTQMGAMYEPRRIGGDEI